MKKKINNIYNSINNKWQSFINKKYINVIFKFLPHNIFLFILMIISLFILLGTLYQNRYNYLYAQFGEDALMDPLLVEPQEISFENVTLDETPYRICFKFATYNRVNNSNFTFSIYHKDELIQQENFNANKIKEKEYYCFSVFSYINHEIINEYHAEFKPIYSDSDNAIALYKNKKTDEATIMFVGKIKLLSLKNISLIIFGIIFLLINYFIHKKNINIEKFWLLVAIIYIIPLTIIIPPYQVPDEQTHFWNAYRLSQLDTFDSYNDDNIDMPSNIDCLYYSHPQDGDKVDNFNNILECTNNQDNSINDLYKDFKIGGNILGFIFSSLGIKIADYFTNSPFIIFYSGRIINTLISILIIFLAIKIVPKHKVLLLSIATIPMFIQQMISYSYDSILNSCIILGIALIIKMIYSEKINWILYSILLLIIGVFIVHIKMIYLPIYALLLLIPNNKFKKNIYKYLYCIGLILICLFLGSLTKTIFASDAIENIVQAFPNKEYIIKNPWMVIPIAFNTLIINGLFYIKSFFGYFGWFTIGLNWMIIISYIIYFVYVFKTDIKIKSDKKDKIINIVIILMIIAGIFASMYFMCSTEGANYVDGVQGRYLIPLLIPLFLIAMSNKTKKENINNNYEFINIIMFHYVLLLLISYY